MEKASLSSLFLMLFPQITTNKHIMLDLIDFCFVSGWLFLILVSRSPDARLGQAFRQFDSSMTSREMGRSVLNFFLIFFFLLKIFCIHFSRLSTISAIGSKQLQTTSLFSRGRPDIIYLSRIYASNLQMLIFICT